jgi:hypothetical protein
MGSRRYNLSMMLVDAINSLGSEYNGYKRKLIEIPKLNYTKFAEINDLLDQLDLKTFAFSKIFNDNNETSFDPSRLEFNGKFKLFLNDDEEYVLFKFKTIADKEYLCYLGKSIKPNYLWELVTVDEEPETVEGEEEPIEGEEDMEEF